MGRLGVRLPGRFEPGRNAHGERRTGARTRAHIDASAVPLTYFARFLADVRDRTHTAMAQSHAFVVSRLAIEAQARAQVITTA